MMLFTASSTTLQFTLLGMIDWEKNFMLPLIGAVGAACGQQLIGRLVKRYNRQSLIIFPVAGIIGLSAVLMGYTSLMDLHNNGLGGIKGALAHPNLAQQTSLFKSRCIDPNAPCRPMRKPW
jgi:hypothetical protein